MLEFEKSRSRAVHTSPPDPKSFATAFCQNRLDLMLLHWLSTATAGVCKGISSSTELNSGGHIHSS